MSGSETACLTAADILAYLARELPADRMARVEEHLDACRLCSAAIEGVAGLEWREGFLRSVESLNARIRTRSVAAARARRASPRAARGVFLTLAATLVLGVGIGLLLTRQTPGEALFAQNFEPYPSTRPLVRGDSPRDPLSEALARYEAKDYAAALSAFAEILKGKPNDATALFYSGLCQLGQKQPAPAAENFERVLALDETEYRPAAEWYLALALLARNDTQAARGRLQSIAAGDGFYRQRARAVVEELDRLR